MKTFPHCLGSLLCIFVTSSRAEAPKAETAPTRLEIMVEDAAPPWSRPDGTGYANDVVVAAFHEMGIAADLRVVPYARCKKAVMGGNIAACVSMTWHEEFKGLVKLSSNPIIFLRADVFENTQKPLPKPKKGEPCRLPGETVVGVVRGYEYPPETMALTQAGVKFETFHSDGHSLKALASQRIDAAIIMTNELEPRNQKAIESQTQDKVRFAFNCGTETGTIGFSLKHSQGMRALDLFEEGYERLKKKGKLKQIASKWGHE